MVVACTDKTVEIKTRRQKKTYTSQPCNIPSILYLSNSTLFTPRHSAVQRCLFIIIIMFQPNSVKFLFFQKPLNKSSIPQEPAGPFDEIPAWVFYVRHTDTARRGRMCVYMSIGIYYM